MSLESKKPWQQASYREPTTSQKTDWNTSSTTILTNENIPPLICSCRLVFAVCAFIALFNMSIMRFNLSFAVVCMVHSEAANKTLKTIEMNCSRSTNVAEPYERQGEFHWSRSQQGRVLSGFFYGFLTSQTLGGWVSDRWGGKRPFILGNVLQGFFAVLMPLAARWTPEALFVLRILQGVASGLSVPAFFQLGARWTAPAERTLLMGLAVAGFPVANIAIYPIAAFLCNYGIDGGWPSIFYATGAFGAGCAVLSYYFIYDLPNDHPRISDEEKRYLNSVTIQGKKPIKIPWKNLLSSGPIFAYFVSHFCFTWGYVTIAIHLPLFLDQVMLFDRNMNGLLSSVPFIGILVSRIIISSTFHPCQVKSGLNSTNKRKLNHTIGSLFVALCLVGVSMMSCSQRVEAVVLLAAGMAVAELAYTGGYGFTLLQIVPRLAGTLSGTSNALANCSGIICPFIVAMVTPNGTQKEWAIVLYITSALYVVQCVTYLIFGSVELVPWAKEDEPAPENSGVKST